MRDWAWTDEGHCVTLLGGITPEAVIAALGASPLARLRGIDALVEQAQARWDESGYNPDEALIGIADIGADWALIAEVNGYLGVTEDATGPLSGGRTVVSHFRNINAVSRFHWWRDGRLLVDVDLLFPEERLGAEPDALGNLDDLGTDLVAAGFQLAERITGVACTPAMFERAEFTLAVAPMPGPDAL